MATTRRGTFIYLAIQTRAPIPLPSLDLGSLPFKQQAPSAVCDGHIQDLDRALNLSSSRIAQIVLIY